MIIDKIRNLSAVAVVAATLQVKYAEMNAINLLVMRNLMILISLNRLANADDSHGSQESNRWVFKNPIKKSMKIGPKVDFAVELSQQYN